MAHSMDTCNHLTVALYVDYSTKKIKEWANCVNCTMRIPAKQILATELL